MYRNIRILVAEDNPDDAFFLKRAFQKAGINAPLHFVADGQQTVGYLAGSDSFADRQAFPFPNLLMLDLKMPGLDGFQVLRWLRQQPELRRLPVVVFTSSDDPRDVNLAHELGANGYTVKPADSDQMSDVITAFQKYWLDRHCYPEVAPKAEVPEPQAG